MRLFDEQTFSAYGPFRNDLNQLRAWQKSEHRGPRPEAMGKRPPLESRRETSWVSKKGKPPKRPVSMRLSRYLTPDT